MTRKRILGWAIAAFLGYLVSLSLTDLARVSRLRSRGVETVGHVSGQSARLRHGETYFVYRFDVEGKPFQGSRRWYMVPSGDVRVTYLPEDPSVNAPSARSELTPELDSYLWLAMMAFYLFIVVHVRRNGPEEQ